MAPNIYRTTFGPNQDAWRAQLKEMFPVRQRSPTIIGSAMGIDPVKELSRSNAVLGQSEAFQEARRSGFIRGEASAAAMEQQEALAAYRGQRGTFTKIGEFGPSAASMEARAAELRSQSQAWSMRGVTPLEAREVERLNWARRTSAAESFGKFSPVIESENFQRARDLDRRIARDKALPGRLAAAKANAAANATAAQQVAKNAEMARMNKVFSKVTSNSGEGMLNRMAGRLYKMTSPGAAAREEKLLNKSIDFGGQKMSMAEAIVMSSDSPDMLKGLGKEYGRMFGKGAGMFDMGASNRLFLNADNTARKAVAGAAVTGYKGLNVVSKATLGASLGAVGFAGAVVGGLALTAASMTGVTASQVADAASTVHQTIKASSKPVYGYSELGQSTQGLVLGLNSRRRG